MALLALPRITSALARRAFTILHPCCTVHLNRGCDKSFVDLISDCSAESLSLLEGNKTSGVGEEYANMALFINWLRDYDNNLYCLVEQMIWSAIISGFLKRSSVDWDVKTEEKVSYFLDSSLIFSILDLSSIESVNYARELLQIIKSSGSCARIHYSTTVI